MGTEQFSLCWDNFHSNMSSGLNALLKSEDLVDVTLAAEGRYIKAHKMVLSVCSPYFRELFSVNPCKHPIVFLKDVSYAALNSLLEFMYQGEVKVSQDDLGMFIKTAEALKIKGLTGDGSNSTDLDDQPEIVQPSTPVIETPSVKRPVPSVEKPQQPVRKKMLGPASKRFKSSEPLAKEPQFRSEEVDLQPSPLEPNIQFKMEPEETILDQPDAAFDTSQADDSSMDNSLVYMMESSKLDQKAGTSSTSELNDATAENQGRDNRIKGRLRLDVHEKLRILREVDKGTKTKREIAKEFQLPESTLWSFLKKRNAIEELAKNYPHLAIKNSFFVHKLKKQ